jgi:cytochrome oxidase assembly protein ShyY1
LNVSPKTPLAKTIRRRSWTGLLIPALLVFAALIALGTWQLQRKAWKEGLIAALDERSAAAPAALPSSLTWRTLNAADDEYRRVTFNAKFEKAGDALVYASALAFRPDVSGLGVWVFTPARLPDGGVVVVNRGFVPSDTNWKPNVAISPPPSADVVITGAMRWPEHRSWFTPQDKADVFFVRDPAVVAAAKGWGAVAPFYIEQESPMPPNGWPRPGKLVPRLPNNHLQYVVTWYGLALVLAVIFAAYVFKSRRDVVPKRT